jgi:hypothetical protein
MTTVATIATNILRHLCQLQFVLKLAKVAQDVWAFAGKNIFLMADLMVAIRQCI